jgi:hypothetical protein
MLRRTNDIFANIFADSRKPADYDHSDRRLSDPDRNRSPQKKGPVSLPALLIAQRWT